MKTSLWKHLLSLKPSGLLTDSDLALQRLKPLLWKIGWLRSVKEGLPVDRAGNCIPWFTYPAISFLKTRVKSEMVVFEYGSGNSTLWFSNHVLNVTSCEHNIQWHNSFKRRIPSNVDYFYQELIYGGEYSRIIMKYEKKFDIIVIDGRDRVNCVKNSLGALKDTGVIIWDNTDREKYIKGCLYLTQNGFRRLDFVGIGPVNDYEWSTSIFYMDNNCLGI